MSSSDTEPVQFLQNRQIAFRNKSTFKPVKDYEGKPWEELVREWERFQDGQKILLTTPSVLVGYRVQVYRVEGTTQWYTAVIVGYNEATRELTVTDDTVLEDHNEDPCLVQMRLIGDGVIESIMRGENVGITPRRSRSNMVLHRQAARAGRRGNAKVAAGPAASKPPTQPPDRGKKKGPDKGKSLSGKTKPTGRSLRHPRTPVIDKSGVKTRRSVRKEESVDEKEESKKKGGRRGSCSRDSPQPEETAPKPSEPVGSPPSPGGGEESEEKEPSPADGDQVAESTEQPEEQNTALDYNEAPQSAASPYRMDECGGAGGTRDDRSVDSGVSSVRSGVGTAVSSQPASQGAASGDERSPSRSSALSSSNDLDHPPTPSKPSTPTPEVWRDPSVVCEVRHVESPQHSRLLMSSGGYGAGGGGGGSSSLHHAPPAAPLVHPPPLPPYSSAAAAAAAIADAELWTKRFLLPPASQPPPSLHYDPHRDSPAARIIKERQKEREKQERDRERQDREKLEKQRAAEQAVHKHFEESLRLAQQKQQQQQQRSATMGWMNSLTTPGSHGSVSVSRLDDKGQVEQARLVSSVERLRQETVAAIAVSRSAAHYYPGGPALHQPRKVVEFPPPAHHRKPDKPTPPPHLPKAEPNFTMYPYASPTAAYHPSAQIPYMEKVSKVDTMVKPALVVNSKPMEMIPNPPIMQDMKNSVIVKNDKSPGLHHSTPSPKLREYGAPPPLAKSPYEYRSPSASPHLHHSQQEVQNLASISKVHVQHRTSHLSPHARSSPLPPQHRQSPHRQSPVAYSKPGPTVPQATVTSYPFPSTPVSHHYQPRPLVSSPHKPRTTPISKATLTPCPYQQLSQHNLPPPPHVQGGLPPPPAAHAHTKSFKSSPPPTCQMQPLDLNISSVIKEEPVSPKRKSSEIVEEMDVKKIKMEEDRPPSVGSTVPVAVTPPVVDRVSPAPPAPSPRPITPLHDDKSNSPGPPKPSYPVLKKAWLQRHSGEDTSTGDVKGTGSSVSMPVPTSTPPPPVKKPEPVSLHSIGSMAVNSIKKPKVSRKPKELNGHVTSKNPDMDDSSSSDPDRKSSPQKRVPPKVKRKKSGRKPASDDIKRKKNSTSSTDSDKESVSDKDSDSGTSNSTIPKKKEEKGIGKKRGRRPKTTPSKNGNDEESRNKKVAKDEDGVESPGRDSLAKPSVGQLKKTGESFLQDRTCFEVAPKLAKCRECRWTPNQRSKNMPNIFCRFYDFRRLRYTKNGQLAIAGFSDPHKDASSDDLKLWLPMAGSAPPGLDVEMSRFLLTQVGDQFCDLLQQEKEATAIHMAQDKTIAWKRVVQGVREMCDVCETTLFNFHWACGKCGFVVCIDCYKGRKNGTVKAWGDGGKDRDELSWLVCTNRQAHELEKLMLTQIIAGDSLATLGRQVHEARHHWGIPMFCSCVAQPPNGISKGESDELSTLRQLLIRPAAKSNGSRSSSPVWARNTRSGGLDTLDEVISSVIEHSVPSKEPPKQTELKHFVRKFNRAPKGREPIPIRIMTLTESKVHYNDVPHSWLCDGKLLRLLDPKNVNNYKIFQDQWKRGQPVVVSDVTKDMSSDLWTPESFVRDFGDTRNDLVDCLTGTVVNSQPMRRFWEGFQCVSKRIKDDQGQPMLLKLKDWPPGDDFADMLPSRFNDLMKVLPMGEYTQRTGRLNLASRLPDCFVRPDLGPKMYTAYGSTTHPSLATTNLHLDISDAVNVMVHVGVPVDVDYDTCIKEVLKAVDEAGCDMLTRRRVRDKGQLPGALWHIYMARDADKIRDLLNKVAVEKGNELEPHHDSIHDQSWYLDQTLRDRLYKEYGVEGYTIIQCMGDAVFIPAGAPHQVRNLHNCIKVAEDFVSPENVSHCFNLTQEFRDLTDTHTNHEDKLQIKNIMYHAVKDSLAVLSSAVRQQDRIDGDAEGGTSGAGGGSPEEDDDEEENENESPGSGHGTPCENPPSVPVTTST